MNVVSIIGRLGQDPELRYTPNGHAVVNLSLAVDNPFDRDKTNWIEVVCWGKTAENVSKYLAKGRELAVVGRLEQQRWEQQDGQKRSKIVVVADRVKFIGPRDEGSTAQSDSVPAYPAMGDDDVPF